ncbi:MAG: saccharopine dehydrogenase NADP-binding domain-containing protein [Candidatus Melainabacteria bacterium]|nr:saccharopine dehydrogenase NADP-binding domain-containing protein [Candidatus Melainabacteria bacterium]
MKYCVLGAGLMGKAVAYNLLQQDDTTQVILVDSNTEALQAMSLQNNNKLCTKIADVKDLIQVEEIFKDVDAAIAAVHYKFNEDFTRAAIKTKTHLCDLGGNNDVVDAQLKMNKEAEAIGVSVIPDCGLAPGMVSVLVKWGLEKFSWVDTVKIRVGGLPQNPKGIFKYERLFSIEGLINEYVEPVRVLRNGKIEIIEPLVEIEEIEFPELGKLEAFTTSGGVSTLIETYKNRLKNLDYKTIRYSGHCKLMREMYESGGFSGEKRKSTAEYLEKTIPLGKEDVTLVKIIFEGGSKKHELIIIDKAKPPFTSMMRMTAFPAAIISQMQAKGQIKIKGVHPQERCVPSEIFISELNKRKIVINGL